MIKDAVAEPPDDEALRLQLFTTMQSEQFRRDTSNGEAYDKAILTYATGALALSVTFTKELIPLAHAHHLWVLEASWFAWTAAIMAVIASYIFGAKASPIALSKYERYYLHREDQAFTEGNRWASAVETTNLTAGVAFAMGALLTVAYVCVNISENTMSNCRLPVILTQA